MGVQEDKGDFEEGFKFSLTALGVLRGFQVGSEDSFETFQSIPRDSSGTYLGVGDIQGVFRGVVGGLKVFRGFLGAPGAFSRHSRGSLVSGVSKGISEASQAFSEVPKAFQGVLKAFK